MRARPLGAQLSELNRLPFDEVATLAVAVVILVGSFWGLLATTGPAEAKLGYVALVTLVGQFYFHEHTVRTATKNTIEAQNNGLDVIRHTVGRIEDRREPTEAERAAREHR